jgi:hypothetical protein
VDGVVDRNLNDWMFLLDGERRLFGRLVGRVGCLGLPIDLKAKRPLFWSLSLSERYLGRLRALALSVLISTLATS